MLRVRSFVASVIVASACATGVAAAQSPPGGPPWQPKDAAAALKLALADNPEPVLAVVGACERAIRAGNKIIFCGNGGTLRLPHVGSEVLVALGEIDLDVAHAFRNRGEASGADHVVGQVCEETPDQVHP